MKKRQFQWPLVALVLGIAVVTFGISCSGPVQSPPAPAQSEVGRFQIQVAGEGGQILAVFLQDTRNGETFVYQRGPGPLASGFWMQIPRVTQPPEYWQQVFLQAQAQSAAAAPAAQTSAPPTTATAPSPAPSK